MTDNSELIANYIRAKDLNRPWLMPTSFAEDARLEMIVKTDAIQFPATTERVGPITDVLVRNFGVENENVYTFCLCPPPKSDAPKFTCPWLVGMSQRDTGSLRVGCGRYDWAFHEKAPRRVRRLDITIDVMVTLPPDCLSTVMPWLGELPYPWCPAKKALYDMPEDNRLLPIARNLQGNASNFDAERSGASHV